jgi:hypothetical protein
MVASKRHWCDHDIEFSQPKSLLRFNAARRTVLGARHRAGGVIFYPDAPLNEAGFLSVFDSNRDLIHATASKVYARGRRGSYDLLSGDF